MSDGELARLKNQIGTLTDAAQVALLTELESRDLQDIPSPESEKFNKELYGVHGWLALLVLGLLVGVPIASVVGVINEYDVTKMPGVDSSIATLYWAIDAAARIGLACWSIYCGVCLLKLKPNAPRTTKRYFIALFLYGALGVVIAIAAGTKSFTASASIDSGMLPYFRGFLGIILWYSYLERSKRVRNTYAGRVADC
jgi:hypothetical protein